MDRSQPIPRRRAMLYTLLLLSASLLVCEVLARLALDTPWLHPGKSSEDPLLRLHPTRGYALRPDQERRWVNESFDVAVQTNERGMRDEPFAAARRADLRIAAAGDSFTFGIGVEGHESWPQQLESLLEGESDSPSVSVLDLGVPGYSARQIRLYLEEVWPDLEPQLAIVGIYAPSYWRVRSPYVLTGGTLIHKGETSSVEVTPNGDRVITPFPPGPLRRADVWIKQHSHLLGHLLSAPRTLWRSFVSKATHGDPAKIREAYEPVLHELAQLHRFVAGNGAQLIVLPINQQEPDGSFSDFQDLYNEVLRDFCLADGIPIVDPLPHLREESAGRPIFRFPTNLHWSKAAHRLAARLLRDEIDARLQRRAHSDGLAPRAGADGRLPAAEDSQGDPL